MQTHTFWKLFIAIIVCHFLHVTIQHHQAEPLLTCDITLDYVTSLQMVELNKKLYHQ